MQIIVVCSILPQPGGIAMKIKTSLDPVSLNDAHTQNHHLDQQNLEIYFESQENLDTYVAMHIDCFYVY